MAHCTSPACHHSFGNRSRDNAQGNECIRLLLFIVVLCFGGRSYAISITSSVISFLCHSLSSHVLALIRCSLPFQGQGFRFLSKTFLVPPFVLRESGGQGFWALFQWVFAKLFRGVGILARGVRSFSFGRRCALTRNFPHTHKHPRSPLGPRKHARAWPRGHLFREVAV